MSITILGKELTNGKATDFALGFLRAQPNTEMVDDPDNEGEQIKKYTDLEWINKRGYDYMKREYKEGKRLLANDAAVVDDNVLD